MSNLLINSRTLLELYVVREREGERERERERESEAYGGREGEMVYWS